MKLHCRMCGTPMQKWGHTRQGKPRFFCPNCKKTATPQRDDVEIRQTVHEMKKWLGGKESLSHMAALSHVTRQALWKRFHPVMEAASIEPVIPDLIRTKVLIVDGTYIHGHTLCALIAVDEFDKIYWKFASYESCAVWMKFLSSFVEPEIIIMDGQKGLFLAAKTLWPRVAIQRCQFHLVAFAIQYIGRRPKEKVGQDLMDILYTLKDAKSKEGRDAWIYSYRRWEQKYEMLLSAKDSDKQFIRPRLRGARLIIRRALPYLFTFLDHPGSPNTTNLVEGWINGAMAEALRLHRGLRINEKKTLAAIILSDLIRKKTKDKSVMERLKYAARVRRARRFGKRKSRSNIVEPALVNTMKLF
jgi:hypothetical protein